jgi:hypothetical protein
VTDRKSELHDHIATLEHFESLYGEFLVERRGEEHNWSTREWRQRERKLKELAPQAEAAMIAAGASRWDEGPVRLDLPARILRFVDLGDGIDDDEQWAILDELPTHIGALKGKLRNTGSTVPDMDLTDWRIVLADRPSLQSTPGPAQGPGWLSRLWQEPNLWVVTIGGGVVVGLIILAVTLVVTA